MLINGRWNELWRASKLLRLSERIRMLMAAIVCSFPPCYQFWAFHNLGFLDDRNSGPQLLVFTCVESHSKRAEIFLTASNIWWHLLTMISSMIWAKLYIRWQRGKEFVFIMICHLIELELEGTIFFGVVGTQIFYPAWGSVFKYVIIAAVNLSKKHFFLLNALGTFVICSPKLLLYFSLLNSSVRFTFL